MTHSDQEIEATGGYRCSKDFLESNDFWAVELHAPPELNLFDPGTKVILRNSFGFDLEGNPGNPNDLEVIADAVWSLDELLLNTMLKYLETVSTPQFYVIRGLKEISKSTFEIILEGSGRPVSDH